MIDLALAVIYGGSLLVSAGSLLLAIFDEDARFKPAQLAMAILYCIMPVVNTVIAGLVLQAVWQEHKRNFRK
jgi:uncharacterized membrane protein YqjE